MAFASYLGQFDVDAEPTGFSMSRSKWREQPKPAFRVLSNAVFPISGWVARPSRCWF